MAVPGKLAPHNIKFLASISPDVVTHRFYYQESPDPVTYDSAYVSLGNEKDADGYINADLAALLGSMLLDGIYNVGVAAIDDNGNESPMSKANDYPLDFVAPDAPGPIIKL